MPVVPGSTRCINIDTFCQCIASDPIDVVQRGCSCKHMCCPEQLIDPGSRRIPTQKKQCPVGIQTLNPFTSKLNFSGAHLNGDIQALDTYW